MLSQCGAVSFIKTPSLTPDCQSVNKLLVQLHMTTCNKQYWKKTHLCLQASFYGWTASTSVSFFKAHKHYVLCLYLSILCTLHGPSACSKSPASFVLRNDWPAKSSYFLALVHNNTNTWESVPLDLHLKDTVCLYNVDQTSNRAQLSGRHLT